VNGECTGTGTGTGAPKTMHEGSKRTPHDQETREHNLLASNPPPTVLDAQWPADMQQTGDQSSSQGKKIEKVVTASWFMGGGCQCSSLEPVSSNSQQETGDSRPNLQSPTHQDKIPSTSMLPANQHKCRHASLDELENLAKETSSAFARISRRTRSFSATTTTTMASPSLVWQQSTWSPAHQKHHS
jgi:hypothetical protein